MSIANASKLLRMNQSITGVRIKYQDLFSSTNQIRNDASNVRKNSNNEIITSTWQQNYGTLFEAIQNERFLVSLMLFMLILLSAYNLMSMLVMTVNQKKSQIAILMTMGATSKTIRNVFLLFGGLVGSFGILLGCFAGLIISTNFGSIINFLEILLNTQFLKVYFIDYFPIDIRFEWVLAIGAITFISCILFTIYPARLASKVDPVQILNNELLVLRA